jgi:thioredoxin-like negative regulator of GroEL
MRSMGAIEELTFVDGARLAEIARQGGTVVVAFLATWNARCQAFAADYLAFAASLGGSLPAVCVDVDECSALAAELDVCSVPTVVVMRAGREIQREVGLDLGAVRGCLAAPG